MSTLDAPAGHAWLFVYGTLRQPALQIELVGRQIPGEQDALDGYRRHDHYAYPVALPETGAQIDGLCLAVTPAELALLDAYEGEDYLRLRVQLRSGRSAWFYRGNPQVYGR